MPRKALLLILLILGACARHPVVLPEKALFSGRSYQAVVVYRVRGAGRTYGGRAVILTAKNRVYAEGLSPFGVALFSLWLEGSRIRWVFYTRGKTGGWDLVPPEPRLGTLWPALLLGRVPREMARDLARQGKVSLGHGYSLRLKGAPVRYLLAWKGRRILEVRPGGKEVGLKVHPLRIDLVLRLVRVLPGPSQIPPPPPVPVSRLDLNRYLGISGD